MQSYGLAPSPPLGIAANYLKNRATLEFMAFNCLDVSVYIVLLWIYRLRDFRPYLPNVADEDALLSPYRLGVESLYIMYC
jgi:hypothetical protein